MSTIKQAVAGTFKSADTEEWLDIHFTRPLGYLWAVFFAKLHIHPNVVTILSILLGIAAACFFALDDLWLNVTGIFLLIWANLYDSADGQLARMTGQKTRLGRILDGFAGDVWFFCIYFAICWRLQGQPMPFTDRHWGLWIWLLCAFTGFICHGDQCKLADYYRNIHLFFLKGREGSELDGSTSVAADWQKASWRREPVWKVFLFFYGRYTQSQERMTPRFQALRKELGRRAARGEALPEDIRTDFLAGSRPLMKWANILTFNTRAIVLYLSLLIGKPLVYLLFEIFVLGALFLYMRGAHEKLCARILERLQQQAHH